MAGSVSSKESDHGYSGQNEAYAFAGDEGPSPSSKDTELEVIEIPAHPQMIQPLGVVLLQATASHDSGKDSDTLTALLRRSRQPINAEEVGPSTRVDLEGIGSTEEFFEEGQEEEDEEGEEGGEEEEERVNSGEDSSTSQPAAAGSVKLKEAKLIAAHRIGQNPFKVTMDGKVNVTPCILTEKDLNENRTKYGRMEGVMLRENEVACSDVSHDICLYEHMFIWGMRLTMGERPRGQLYLVAMFAFYGLSPGQISANSFADLMGFWTFINQKMGEKTPISKGPFFYFFELKKGRKEGQYYFFLRKTVP